MLTKILATVLTAALGYIAVRKFTDWQLAEKTKVKAKARENKISSLRQDPKTGVYHPED